MYFTKRVLDFELDGSNVLLINTISSAMDIVDLQTYSLINEMKNSHYIADESLLSDLIQRGYVFESEEAEKSYIAKYAEIHAKALKNNFMRNYIICPTMGCNLRCVYCFEGDDNHCNHKVMTIKQLDTIFNYIKKDLSGVDKVSASKNISISLYGGEPLLPNNEEIVKATLTFAFDRNIEVRIITNGTTIPQYLALLKKYPNAVIQITLDGDKNIHDKRRITANKNGTFDSIVDSIDLLVKAGIKVNLRTNVDLKNLNSIPNLIQFIKEKKWVESGLVLPYVAPVFDYCDGTNNSMEESKLYNEILKIEPNYGSKESVIKKVSSPCINFLQSFFDQTNKIKPWKINYCEATSGGNLVFSPDGKIATCLMLAGKGRNQIGEFDDSKVTVYQDKADEWTSRDIMHMEKCKDCKYGLICGGGCPVAALDINKDINCPVCSDIDETIKALINSKKDEILSGL